ELARRIASEEVALHHAIAHDVATTRRHAFVVEGRRGLAARQMWVLADADVRRKNLFALAVEEKRRLAIETAAACGVDVVTDEAGGDGRFVQHGTLEGRQLASSEAAGRAFAGDAAHFHRAFQIVRRSRHGIPVVALHRAVLFTDHRAVDAV